MQKYIVTAVISGKRVNSSPFKTKQEALAYAKATNKYRKGANARVKKY